VLQRPAPLWHANRAVCSGTVFAVQQHQTRFHQDLQLVSELRQVGICLQYLWMCAFYRWRAQWLLYVPPGLTFTNSTFCPHSVFMCFVWIAEQTAIISLYSINWLVCITETECVYCAVRTVFMCFVWISEQTAIISLYSINWLVCVTETECVYCAVRTVFMCFVWISEQTAIISLYNINWLVSIT
jgi:hypothetical protein